MLVVNIVTQRILSNLFLIHQLSERQIKRIAIFVFAETLADQRLANLNVSHLASKNGC